MARVGQTGMWATACVQRRMCGLCCRLGGFAAAALRLPSLLGRAARVPSPLALGTARDSESLRDRDATPGAQQCRCLPPPVALMPSDCPNRAFLRFSGAVHRLGLGVLPATLTSKGAVRIGGGLRLPRRRLQRSLRCPRTLPKSPHRSRQLASALRV